MCREIQIALFVFLVICIAEIHPAASQTGIDSSCPLWTFRENGSCVCGSNLGGLVHCDHTTLQISILTYYCMTYSSHLNKTLVGNCWSINFNDHINSHYSPLLNVENVSRDLNNVMCKYNKHCLNESECHQKQVKYLQRTGQMCGSCAPRYAPPVYSYNPICVRCDRDYKYNWLKYIAIAFLPLTAFYIIVVLFRVTVTSGAMNSYVLVSQIITSPIMERILNRMANRHDITPQIVTSLYGIWNLDFFRDAYPLFCISPKLSTLQTLALDYLVAVYPILLIVITYLLVKLHDESKVARIIWRPFYRCFTRIRKEWEIRSSLVAIFVTFLLLSYVKILNVSFYLLMPNILYEVNGNKPGTTFLYYDGTYEFFGKRHLPYAFLALFMLFVFNIIPLLLLCLYPFRCFQKCLNCLRIRSPALHICMDTFHAAYKLEPRDYRWFAAFFVMLRLLNHIVLLISRGPLYEPLAGLLFSVALAIVAIFRPYKKSAHVVVDIILFSALCVILWGLPAFHIILRYQPHYVNNFRIILLTVVAIPPAYGIGLLIYNLFGRKLFLKFKNIAQRRFLKSNDEESSDSEPYRLNHGDVYAPLLAHRPAAKPLQTKTDPNINS